MEAALFLAPKPAYRGGMTTTPALLIIDAQLGIDTPSWGQRNQSDAETNIAALLAAWRQTGNPVLHVQHDSLNPESPLRPGLPGHAFKPEALPNDGEPVFNKTVNSAFIGTTLEQHLRAAAIQSLIVVGFTTDHCISTSVRMAANLGFEVTVVSDATATHERTDSSGTHFSADVMHATALASLDGEFAKVLATQDVLRRVTQ